MSLPYPRGDVLFFLCLNDRGGAEISMLTIAREMMARGTRVTLAVYGGRTGLARALGFTGEVIDFETCRTFMALPQLWWLLVQRRFLTVISALPYTNLAAALAAHLAGFFGHFPRLVLTEHGMEGVVLARAASLTAYFVRYFYARAWKVVAVSEALERQWRDLLSCRAGVVTIYNPVVPDEPQKLMPPANDWLSDNIPVIMAVGRLKPEKNFKLLLNAFARVAESVDARLILLGEGEERSELEHQAHALGIEDKCNFPGFMVDMAAWLPYAKLFVSSSRREGFGNALVEALSWGIPVVAVDCPCGPREILKDGSFGILVTPSASGEVRSEVLAQAILSALANKHDAQFLRQRARDFTLSRCIDGYLAVSDTKRHD